MYISSRDLSESKQAYLSEHVLLSEVWMWMTVVFPDGAFSFAVHMGGHVRPHEACMEAA